MPRFRRRKSWRFGKGDVSRPRSFRCYIATSRCPTAFLLFTRFLVARSSRAIPSSLALRAFLRAFRLPLLPGLSTATFARVRCEECDTPRFTTRTREMRKRGGGVRPRGRPRRRGILEKGDVQRLEDRERESGERLLVDPASTVWRRRRGKGLEYISRGFSSRAVSRMDLSDSPRLV